MERKRVLVAFGDIYRFQNWMRRALTSPEESRDLIDEVYAEFDKFVLESNCYVKLLGDGILVVKELGAGHNCIRTSKLLKQLHDLSQAIQVAISYHYPRPAGFRMRVAAGHVWKRNSWRMVRGKRVRSPEYVGYIVNLTHTLLDVEPQIMCICHESVTSIIGSKKTGLVFKRLGISKIRPKSVDSEDLLGLSSFERAEPMPKGN